MNTWVLEAIGRGSTFEYKASIADSLNPAQDFAGSELWFYGKLSKFDLDADAVIVATLGAGITQSGTNGTDILIRVDDVCAAKPNYDMVVYCELKIRLADGFEAVIATGELPVKTAVAPHD